MQITENVHTFLNLFGVISRLQVQVTGRLGSRSKSEIRELKARELKTLLLISRLTLLRGRPLGLKDLAEHLNVPTSTMSLLVSSLVERKLISREVDAGNRRCVLITLSPRGRGMIETMMPEFSRVADDLFGTLSEEERKLFHSTVRKLYCLSYPDEEKGAMES